MHLLCNNNPNITKTQADNIIMRGHKAPAVAYITRLIYTTGKPDFNELLARSPLTTAERELVMLYADGSSYKELAELYHVTTQTIYTRKRSAYIKLHSYIVGKLREN